MAATYGDAWAVDAAGVEERVTLTLGGQTGRRVRVRVTVPMGWVTDAARVFPVSVDPTFYWNMASNASWDTQVSAAYPNSTQGGTTELRIGDAGSQRWRSLSKFELPGLARPTRRVTSARIDVYNSYAYSCNARPVRVFGIAQDWETSTVTWNNQPTAFYNVPEMVKSFAHGYSGSYPGAWESLDVTALAQQWVTLGAVNHGVMFLAPNEADAYAYKRFRSGETGNKSAPALYIDYNDDPRGAAGVPGTRRGGDHPDTDADRGRRDRPGGGPR